MKIIKLEGTKEDEEGFEMVHIVEQPKGIITPHCKKHGAMNCIKTKKGDLLWRCYSEYYSELREGDTLPHFKDRACNSCCITKTN